MVSETRDSTFSSLSILSAGQIPGLVSSWSKSNLAFGLVRISGNEFGFAASPARNLIPLNNSNLKEKCLHRQGFVVFPFDGNRNQGYLIPALLHPQIHDFSDIGENTAAVKNPEPAEGETTESYYKFITEKAVEEIKQGRFQKLVLARQKTIAYPGFDPGNLVQKLLEAYPLAHLIVFQIPGQGLWISASPEILLEQKQGESHIHTMALAGTQNFTAGDELKTRAWTEKEIEEQALVSGFIKNKLYECGYNRFLEKGPYTVQAGNLVHLRTDFQVEEKSESSFFEMAETLHPTPAVCGSPADAAADWLRQHENFDREFYTGFGGIIGGEKNKLVVLLRICQVRNERLTFFAGAGITALSVPDKEWQETTEKLQTLMALL
jgi:isochorismate synthase